MKKTKLFIGAVLSLIGGLAMMGVTNAAVITGATVGGIGTLTICGHEYLGDTDSCITIMDKNLGATTTGAGPSAPATSYGNYYKWGNNSPYIGGADSTYNSDDNAWGGGYDESMWDYPAQNLTGRQGPCPTGYHVPGAGEWAALMDMYAGSSVYGLYTDITLISNFYNDLFIPLAGYRDYNDGNVREYGDNAFFWSSSSVYGDLGTFYMSHSNEESLVSSYLTRADGSPVRCFKNSPVVFPLDEGGANDAEVNAQILLMLGAGEVIIGVDTGASGSVKNLGSVKVSNSDQILSGSFGANYFWIEDMKGAESGYYTTLSITDLSGENAPHMISNSNIRLKPTRVSLISGAAVVDPFVLIGANNTRNDWMTGGVVLTYFNRQNTPVNNAGRVGRYGDDLQIKVNIPKNTSADIYRATITYTLYDLAQ